MMRAPRAVAVTCWQAAAWAIAGAVMLVFAGANAHLVYVATASQPACVPHARLGDAGGGAFSAAQSACPGPAAAASAAKEKRP